MWRSLIDKFSGKDRKRGYTMTELLAVIGIIAVVVAIAIPSIFFISRTLKFKQRNDYAKTVFLAAQANLSEMRSDGSLFKLQTGCDSEEVPEGHCGFPTTEWSYEYVFASSEFPEPEGNTRSAFDTVLPVNSVESVVRKRNIIIEYNPLTGNVFAVFYCSDEILSQYREGTLPRDEEERKKLMLGYYDGSGLSSSELDLESSEAYMVFDNAGQEGVLTVKVPVSESYYAHLNEFMNGLSIELTMNGEFYGGSIGPFMVDVSKGKIDVDGKTVMFDFTMDSLKDKASFANMAATGMKADGTEVSNSDQHLSDYLDESEFAILPGDNVLVKAKVDFNPEEIGIEVDVDDAFLVFNPMFDQLGTDNAGNFTLSVSNGRHLQNLNAIAPTVADRVSGVAFTGDVYWNETVDYYNNKYGMGGTYYNNGAENPCRGLPYFVPVHNEYLFGTATFQYPNSENGGGIWDFIGDFVGDIFGPDSQITAIFKGNPRVPTLTDELEALAPDGSDQTIAQGHAQIAGYNHRVYYLNIDSTKYTVPNVGEKGQNEDGVELKLDGTYYATGVRQVVDYQFTGLFGYVNTYVSDLHVVNPIVKGHTFVDTARVVPVWGIKWNGLIPEYTILRYENEDVQSNPATGALIGAAGYNTWVVNCSVYLDTQDPYFNRAYMTHGDYDVNADQNWYGVSGKGAVGGLIGYAKSHRTTSEDLSEDLVKLAFRDCFAAVNVTGIMRGDENSKHYGYSNGVGGLIGNSQLTNFFNCYASGNVKANGLYLDKTGIGEVVNNKLFELFDIHLDLPYNGRTSIGVGGFVGTSHGTRYTRCFATGNVAGYGTAKYGAGGFVGIMSLDESVSYGNDKGGEDEIAQTTILTECYAVGRATCNGESGENFSGANARVNFNLSQTASYITNDYYRLYAPMYYIRGTKPAYNDLYIFRDSYYLSSYYEASQENSNNCATAELHSTFQNLVAAHQNADWREDHLDKIKDSTVLAAFFFLKPSLNNTYRGLYAEGYQTGWGPATEATTHSYSMNASGAKYPFTKLENLDYYGDWPGVPSSAGLAYYETYLQEDGTESGIHIYFDRDNTSELATDPTTVVYSDGYAVLTAGKGVVKVEVDGKTFSLRGKKVENTNQYTPDDEYEPNDAFYPGDDTYHVYLMTDEIMEAAMQESIRTGEFYIKVTITDPENTDKKYVTYFNPAVALTQVNPIKDSAKKDTPANYNAVKPSTIPSQLNVRSARQLAALSRNKHLWGEDFHYVQQFDIDAASYKWPEGTSMEIGSIGTDKDVFKGTYQGSGGYVTQAKISGFEPTKGFFGSVANTGKIINLDITVGELTVGTEKDTNVGILAGTNGGIIDNVDLTIQGDVTLTAKNAAGLLVGRNFGSSAGSDKLYPASITNCAVTGQNAAIDAGYAGGLVGEAVGDGRLNLSEFSNNSVKLTELTSNGGMVGGMVGSAAMVNFTKPTVELKLQAENALYAGGFAGGVYDGSVTNLEVALTGSCSAKGTLAGLAGNAAGVSFAAAKLDLARNASLTADVAAGVFGVADSINIKNATIYLTNNHMKGTSGAAGFAYQILGESFVQTASVPLTGGSITATEGKAAGYAVVNEGSISTSVVKLGDTKTGGKDPESNKNAVAITGGTEAVGFAGTVSGSISNCSISGFGSITATAADGRAAGFAGDVTGSIGLSYVSPAYNDHTDYYNGNSNDNLPVKAKTVAGFALSVGEEGEIYGCYTLCKLNGSAYGFAVSNEGTISESTSNVTQTGGVSFVGDHSGLIANCYGWYGNGEVDNVAPAFGSKNGKITSSYFVNVDNREGKAELYDNSGKLSEVSPSQITPELLNTENYKVWKLDAKSYGTFAYDKDLRPGFYPYPRLRDHHGDWVREVQYAYGVVYYEKYHDGSMAYTIKDLSNPAETVEGELYGLLDNYSVALKGNDMDIEDTGYVLFYNELKCPYATGENGVVGPEVDDEHPLYQDMPEDHPLREGNRYIVCELASDKPIEIIAQTKFSSGVEGDTSAPVEWERKIHIVPHFANAFVPADNKEFEVRTPEQLSYVGYNNEKEKIDYRGATFKQTHDIEVEELDNIGIFIGTYTTENDSELRIKSAPAGWMTTVYAGDGRYGPSSVNLHNMILEDVDEKTPIFGTVAGNVSGTITVEGDIDGNLFGSVNKNGTVSDMTVTAPTASASVVGEVSGTVSGVTVEVPSIEVADKTEGKDENEVDVFGILANTSAQGAVVTNTTVKTNEIAITDLKATVGGLIGSNAGTISGSTVQGIEDEAPVVITLGDNTNDDDRILTVGGLVGENIAKTEHSSDKIVYSISGSTANVDICYNQVEVEDQEGEDETVESKVETIVIGGLVGSNAGAIKDTTATGSISTNIHTTGRNFIVGGAIAYDCGAVYTDMVSTVIVDPEWGGCTPVNQATIYSWENEGTNAVNPSGAGPVGKFVGYVTSGAFTNCTAIDNAQSGDYNLQFLGEIQPVPVKLEDISYGYTTKPTGPSVEYTSDSYPAGTDKSVYDWLQISSDLRFEKDTEYRLFEATMTDCYFDYPDCETLQQQRTDMSNMYFYQAAPQDTITNFSVGSNFKIAFTGGSSIKVYNLRNGEPDDGVYRLTKYFYKQDNKYYYLYLKVTSVLSIVDWVTQVEVAIDTNSDGTPDKSIQTGTNIYSRSITVYEAQNISLSDATNYMIVNQSKNAVVAWDGDAGITSATYTPGTAFDSDNAAVYRGVWKYGSANTTFLNVASGKYLSAGSVFNVYPSEKQVSVAQYIPNGCTAGDDAYFNFGNMSTAYHLYTVTEGTHWYRTTLTDTGLFNHICGYQNTDLAKTEFVPEEVLEVLNVEEEEEKETEKSSTRKEKSKTTAEKTSGGAKRKKNK